MPSQAAFLARAVGPIRPERRPTKQEALHGAAEGALPPGSVATSPLSFRTVSASATSRAPANKPPFSTAMAYRPNSVDSTTARANCCARSASTPCPSLASRSNSTASLNRIRLGSQSSQVRDVRWVCLRSSNPRVVGSNPTGRAKLRRRRELSPDWFRLASGGTPPSLKVRRWHGPRS